MWSGELGEGPAAAVHGAYPLGRFPNLDLDVCVPASQCPFVLSKEAFPSGLRT